jgi:hypothetical protein
LLLQIGQDIAGSDPAGDPPLAQSVFFGPMMGGLTVAAILTLVFLPALYAAWFKARRDEPGRGRTGDPADHTRTHAST